MPVERGGGFVFGVDDQGVSGDFGAERARQGVGEQRAAQASTSMPVIHGEASHPDGRHGGVDSVVTRYEPKGRCI